MKLLRWLASASLAMTSSVWAGGSLDLSINNDFAGLEYDATKVGSGLHVVTGVLHHEEDGDLASIGLNVVDVRSQQSNVYIGVGGKIYGYLTDEEDSGALAIGGFARYMPPALMGLGFAGHVYYAPKVTSFNETENFADLGARLEYKLLPTAKVYLGYRYIQANEPNDVEIEILKSGHFGLRVDF